MVSINEELKRTRHQDCHMDPDEWNVRKHQLFKEHLPYELTMLDAATHFLSSDVSDDRSRLGWFRRQSAIEAFWMHARLLEEFFTQPANRDGSGHHASAKDFAPKFQSQLKFARLVEEKINPQIVHINYYRESDTLKKLGSQIIWVKEQIDKDVTNFVNALMGPKIKQHVAVVSQRRVVLREWGRRNRIVSKWG
jgi:hypothetical protein